MNLALLASIFGKKDKEIDPTLTRQVASLAAMAGLDADGLEAIKAPSKMTSVVNEEEAADVLKFLERANKVDMSEAGVEHRRHIRRTWQVTPPPPPPSAVCQCLTPPPHRAGSKRWRTSVARSTIPSTS